MEFKFSLNHCIVGICLGFSLLPLASCTSPTDYSKGGTQDLAARYASTLTAAAAHPDVISDDLKTAIPRASATAATIYSTRTALAQVVPTENMATRTAAEPILAELPLYQVNANDGYIAWIHPPATLEVEGYHQTAFRNDYSMITAQDFVISADITWNTKFGASGCGFLLRSNGDAEKPSAYMVALSRGRTGYLYFIAQKDGKPANFASVFINQKDKKFNWQQDSSNHLVVVARGKELSIYSNYTLVAVLDVTTAPTQPNLPQAPVRPAKPNISPNDTNYGAVMDHYLEEMRQYQIDLEEYQQTVNAINTAFEQVMSNYDPQIIIESGFMGLLAFDESGKSTCKFDNAWLWIIKP